MLITLAHRLESPLRGYALAAGLRLLRRREVPLRTPWARFVAPRNDHTFLHPFFDEPLETALVCRCLAQGAVTLEVGANRGWYTLLAAAFGGPEGRVVAFEPDPRPRAQLKRNLKANPSLALRVSVRDLALAEAPGKGRFKLAAQPSLSHLTDVDEPGITIVATGSVDSEVRSAGLERVDLLKVDVEGAEVRVLRGAAETLRIHRPVVLVEAEPPHLGRAGFEVDDLRRSLPPDNDVYWVSRNVGALTPWVTGRPDQASNLLALPPERELAPRLPVLHRG